MVDRHTGVGNDVAVTTEVRQRLAKRNTEHRTLAQALEGSLRRADRAHAVMNPARAQTTLRDLKTTAWPSDDGAHREAHVVEEHLGVTVGLVQMTEHRQHA